MTLIKTGLLNGIAVAIKIITLLGLNKVLAIYIGPTGYAVIGQYQNAVQILGTLACGGVNAGVIKYTAEYYDDEKMQYRVWRTAGAISIVSSIIVAIIVVVFNKTLAAWLLGDESLSGAFIWLAVTLTLFSLNMLFLAILNGKKLIRQFVIANIAGSILSLIVTVVLAVFFGLYGALIALSVYQSVAFFVTFALIYKTNCSIANNIVGPVEKGVAKKLFKYALIAITSAITVPVSNMVIRNHLGETLGWDSAGCWEAMWRLSAAYLMLFTSTLSVYYLPRFSEIRKNSVLKREILQGYKVIMPIAVTFGAMVYFLRNFIIDLLFSVDFSKMEVLFLWQVIGDVLKIGSWLLSYIMLSRAMTTAFIATEILFTSSFVLLTACFVNFLGLEGVALAYCLNYLLYFIVVSVLMNRYVKSETQFVTANS